MIRISQLKDSEGDGRSCSVKGWVKTKRESAQVVFIELTDGSSLKGIQVVLDKDNQDASLIAGITTGSSVEVQGTVVPSPAQGQSVEIHADTISLIGACPADTYPLQKKKHSYEFLREISHLRPRTNTFGAVARIRSAMSFAIHRFFTERDFLYIHTPIITGSDAEGAGQMFQVSTLDLENPPRLEDGSVNYQKDFFGKKSHLTVSGQLQVENFACALSNVYTFGPTFRAENSNTTRHLAEFWMIEPEMAFCDLDGDRAVAEEFIKYILSYVLEKCAEDMAFFDQWVHKGIIDSLKKVIESRFAHMTYTQAMEHLQKAECCFDFKPEWGCDLQTEHERYLSEEVVGGPVVITDYPKDIKAFYMKLNSDGKTVRAMDVLVPRLGEIIGGSQREDDLEKLTSRIRDMGMDPEEYDWYLDLRRYGSVPHSGFGLGFERLIQYVTGLQNIRDVIPFPRTVKSLEF